MKQRRSRADTEWPLPSRILVARQLAEISQAELAKRAKTSQSAIAAYETGKIVPNADTLHRILVAAEFRPSKLLRSKCAEVTEIGRSLGAIDIKVFGSAANNNDAPESDIDLLVTYSPVGSTHQIIKTQYQIEDALGIEVDIVAMDGLRPLLNDQHARILLEAVPL